MEFPTYTEARETLLRCVRPVGTETVPLDESLGRILAEDLVAAENIPGFDVREFYVQLVKDLKERGF